MVLQAASVHSRDRRSLSLLRRSVRFSSEVKFVSGTAWPSSYGPVDPTHVTEVHLMDDSDLPVLTPSKSALVSIQCMSGFSSGELASMTSRIVYAHIGHSLLMQLACKLLKAKHVQTASTALPGICAHVRLLLCEGHSAQFCQ